MGVTQAGAQMASSSLYSCLAWCWTSWHYCDNIMLGSSGGLHVTGIIWFNSLALFSRLPLPHWRNAAHWQEGTGCLGMCQSLSLLPVSLQRLQERPALVWSSPLFPLQAQRMSKKELSCWILLLHLATNTPCLGRKGHLPPLFQSTGCSPSLRVSIAARPDGIRTTKGCFISISPEDFFPSLYLREQGHPISALHFIGDMRLWHMLSREGLREDQCLWSLIAQLSVS